MFLFRLVKIKKFSEKSRNCFHLMQWSYPTKILSKCSHNATSPKQPIHPTFIFFSSSCVTLLLVVKRPLKILVDESGFEQPVGG